MWTSSTWEAAAGGAHPSPRDRAIARADRSRANLFRYPPGAVGRRHIDPIQEEVFVVLEGTLTIDMGEGDSPERHELAKGSVLVVRPGTALQLSNRGDEELRALHLRRATRARRDDLPTADR